MRVVWLNRIRRGRVSVWGLVLFMRGSVIRSRMGVGGIVRSGEFGVGEMVIVEVGGDEG